MSVERKCIMWKIYIDINDEGSVIDILKNESAIVMANSSSGAGKKETQDFVYNIAWFY